VLEDLEAYDVPLNPTICRSLISVYESAKRPDLALQLYQQMLEQRVPLQTPTWNGLICLCVRSRQWERALSLLQVCGPTVAL
jgi:pentatricopeptide repeat protein